MPLRQCLRDPIPEIDIAAQRLDGAVSAHLRGDRDVAEELLRLADDKVVWSWLDSVWGKASRHSQRLRVLECPPVLPRDQRAIPRTATAEAKRLVHVLDRYYCVFCKIPVIRAELREAVRKQYPIAVPWNGTNATQHAAFQCMPSTTTFSRTRAVAEANWRTSTWRAPPVTTGGCSVYWKSRI